MVVPSVVGDEGATVTGDAESGYTVMPSANIVNVEVDLHGIDPDKVTIEVSVKVKTVASNGAKVKVVSGVADITLDGMKGGDSKVGDGERWTPEIKVKGGSAAFYSIGVGKGE